MDSANYQKTGDAEKNIDLPYDEIPVVQRPKSRMPSLRQFLLILLVTPLIAIGIVSAFSKVRCLEPSNEDQEAFRALLNTLEPAALHEVLHTNLKEQFQDGVFESDKQALEAVHLDQGVLAHSLVDLVKRQTDGSNSSTSDPPPSSTPPTTIPPTSSDTSTTPDSTTPSESSTVSVSTTISETTVTSVLSGSTVTISSAISSVVTPATTPPTTPSPTPSTTPSSQNPSTTPTATGQTTSGSTSSEASPTPTTTASPPGSTGPSTTPSQATTPSTGTSTPASTTSSGGKKSTTSSKPKASGSITTSIVFTTTDATGGVSLVTSTKVVPAPGGEETGTGTAGGEPSLQTNGAAHPHQRHLGSGALLGLGLVVAAL